MSPDESPIPPAEDSPWPSETPLMPAPVFPPIPVTADPQTPTPQDDPLDPAVPAYPAAEPVPDPPPDWLRRE